MEALTLSNKNIAAQVLTDAFAQNEFLINYLLTTSFQNRSRTNTFFQFKIDSQSHNCFVNSNENIQGVAIWEPPNHIGPSLKLSEVMSGIKLPFQFGFKSFNRMLLFQNLSMSLRKQFAKDPHWYLDVIGTSPSCRGSGIASKLMLPILDRAKKDGVSVYLETQTKDNIGVYRHFGFQVIAEKKIFSTDYFNYCMLKKN